MRGTVLVCDNSAFIGKRIAYGLVRRGLKAVCCRNSADDIIRCISGRSPSAAVLIVYDPDDEALRFTERLAEMFPDTALITGLFSSQNAVHMRFLKAGAEHSFIVPICSDRLYTDIIRAVRRSISRPSPAEDFLYKCGFPERLKGFFYLASAMEICIGETHLLSDGVTLVYRRIAENTGAEARAVERDIRNFASLSDECGAMARLRYGRSSSAGSNRELICMACDAFVIYVRSRKNA